jgi:hypothetical protein
MYARSLSARYIADITANYIVGNIWAACLVRCAKKNNHMIVTDSDSKDIGHVGVARSSGGRRHLYLRRRRLPVLARLRPLSKSFTSPNMNIFQGVWLVLIFEEPKPSSKDS